MSWVDVTFASGRSTLLLGERVVALVGAGPDAGTTIALMKVDDGENSLIADLGRLSDGRDDHALNEFVALVNHEDQVHLLIRGSFGASVRRSSGTLEVFSGIGLLGWTEVVLDSADVVELHDGSPGLSREPTQYRATLGIVPASTANVRILDRPATTVDPSSLDEENADNGEASDIDSGALPKTSQFGVEDREEASNGALEGALVEVEPGEVVGVADEIGEGGGGVLPADANSLDHGETLLEPGDFRSTASDESGSIDGLASIDVDVDQEEPAVERSGEYDDLFGATLILMKSHPEKAIRANRTTGLPKLPNLPNLPILLTMVTRSTCRRSERCAQDQTRRRHLILARPCFPLNVRKVIQTLPTPLRVESVNERSASRLP